MTKSVRIFSVSEVNGYIRRMFDHDYALSSISIEGEVSNCKFDQRGHLYFSLKDDSASISCVMYKGSQPFGLKCKISNGMKCIVSGNISVYEKSGTFQIYARIIQEKGVGDLYEQFEALKLKLRGEGLFDESHKKPLKKYARKIGVVTASTGAVIHDIINVRNRRNPYVEIILYPAKVQGDDAACEIARGIYFLDSLELDCIIVGRGGGSMEDLWAFNEESVVRAVYECSTPVISAVGHETDTTLCDFAADMRAPTPSAACELAVFDVSIELERLKELNDRICKLFNLRLSDNRLRLYNLESRLKLCHPAQSLERQKQQLASFKLRLSSLIEKKIMQEQGNIVKQKALLTGYEGRLLPAFENNLKAKKHYFELLIQRLDSASPVKRLTGGFVYAKDQNGQPLVSVGQVSVNEDITLRVPDGVISARIYDIRHENEESSANG